MLMLAFFRLLYLAVAVFPAMSAVAINNDVPELYRQIAARHHVPGEHLFRFALGQSKRNSGKTAMPWPWTVRVDGNRYQFVDRISMFRWLVEHRGKKQIVFGFDNRPLLAQSRAVLWQETDPVAMLERAAVRLGMPVLAVPVGEKLPGKWQDLIARVSRETCVDEWLMHAVVRQESGYRKNAVSKKGAVGLMQLMPGTARGLGLQQHEYFDPYRNLWGGATYLCQQLQTFGSLELALAAYNAGPGNVRKYGGIPPFPETQQYVAKITTRYASLRGKAVK